MRLLLGSALAVFVTAHTRLECPPPRSGNTGQKVGPCDAPDDPTLPAYPLMPNALNTITWLESIPHPGAPGRFALSLDGQDEGFETCILLVSFLLFAFWFLVYCIAMNMYWYIFLFASYLHSCCTVYLFMGRLTMM